ncbi:MAG: insulinase family protein, partial [Oscillospiraceae bacterium]|nr:insulinase family protein [Oscillospiraceae bacterium]
LVILFTLAAMIIGLLPIPAAAALKTPETGSVINGFSVTDVRRLDYIDSDILTFEHIKTGAQVLFCINEDRHRSFNITFRTPLYDDTGIPHTFEHAILSGSEKYPSQTITMKLLSQTYMTSLNGTTYKYNTLYPLSSLSEEQLLAVSDFYLDSVFHPLILSDSYIFDREGWHYELDSPDDDLTVSGTTYTEIQMHNNSVSVSGYNNLARAMYPGSTAEHFPGGTPEALLTITHDDLIKYHKEYYHPSNSLTLIYGDVDYEKFLNKLDEYFSEYDKKEYNIDNKYYVPTENYIEKTYEVPAADGSAESAYVIYAVELKDCTSEELAAVNIIADLYSQILNGSGIYCSISSSDTPYPVLAFASNSLTAIEAQNLRETAEELFRSSINEEFSQEWLDSAAAMYKRANAKAFEGSGVGLSFCEGIARTWAAYGDLYYAFDLYDCDVLKLGTSQNLQSIAKKYFSPDSRRALVTTVSKPGLLEENQSSIAAALAEKKEKMSDDEINAVVESTKAYRARAQQANDELDNKLLKELKVVDIKDLPEETRDYNITDVTDNGIRYVNSVANIKDIGKGRIMADASGIKAEDLPWLYLYNTLIGYFDTEKYSAEELRSLAARYADCSTDITTVAADNENGFIPYLIFKYEGFGDESAEIMDVAEQMLFKTDFSDTETLKSLIGAIAGSANSSINMNGYGGLISLARASSGSERGYMDTLSGLAYVDLIKSLSAQLEEDPAAVADKLTAIRDSLYNRNGAVVVYSGNEENIKRNNAAAHAMLLSLPYTERAVADYSSLKADMKDVILPTDTTINYNGIYAPLNVLGLDYTLKTEVAYRYIVDRFCIPELRNQYNVYSLTWLVGTDGIGIMSYRDPNIDETFEVFKNLGDKIRNDNLTQEQLDGYILSEYSYITMPRGELHDAYWAAADYTDGFTPEVRAAERRDVKSTTIADIKAYADVFDKINSDGVKFTMTAPSVVYEKRRSYDEIINPLDYDIPVMVVLNVTEISSDVLAQLIEDITSDPARAVSECLGYDVSWNENLKLVEILTED